MAESILVSELQTICRDRTDQADSGFISDAELLRYINTSYKELYNKLIKANATYFLKSQSYNVTPSQATYELPTDFFKVKGVDILISSSRRFTAKPFNFEQRNRFGVLNNYLSNNFRYIIQGNEIKLVPEPNSLTSFEIFYIPLPITISTGTETINTVNGAYQFLIADVCRRIAIKSEDTNVADFTLEKQESIKDIMDNFAVRDEGFPKSVTDVHAINDYYYGEGDFY